MGHEGLGRALVVLAALSLCAGCIGCGGALTSKENARLLGEFEDRLDYDTPPTLISAARPEYPEMARQVGAEGRVVLKVLVQEDGSIGSIQIVEMPNPILVDQAITALRRSIVAPATKDGVPCCATMLIPFIFDKGSVYARGRATVEADETGYVDRTEPVDIPTETDTDIRPNK